MPFWIAAAALIALTTAVIVWPLVRAHAPLGEPGNDDGAVYRAQLTEIDADVRRGVLAPADAASARAEIGRRLLRSDDESRRAERAQRRSGGRRLAPVAVALALFVPFGATLLYASTGSPGLADAPLAGRQRAGADLAAMIAAAELRLREDPEDGRGYEVLAPIYLRTGESEKAIAAFRGAIERLGDGADRQAGLGEALTQAANGEVTAEARSAFDAALRQDPASMSARFHMALDLSQEGDVGAADAWASIIADSPADAPWLSVARAAEAEARGVARVPATQPGPDAGAVAAASDLSAEDRNAMVDGMVARLAARLAENPDDVGGWTRLIGSYAVLGDANGVSQASAQARQIFAEGSTERATIETFLRELADKERPAQ